MLGEGALTIGGDLAVVKGNSWPALFFKRVTSP